MNCIPEDLWTIILSRVPLKSLTSFKLVCKQWKYLIGESSILRDLYLCHHQNSHCSWSFMSCIYSEEVLARHDCETWGLKRSLESYISPFLQDKFKKKHIKANVLAYTDFGLILFVVDKKSLYMANPVTRECVKIKIIPRNRLQPSWPCQIVTRTEKGVILSYKVVFLTSQSSPTFFIYSSETGLWSSNIIAHTPLLYVYKDFYKSISLNGSLHWISHKDNVEVVISHDFYCTRTRSEGYVPHRVTPLPDVDKSPQFARAIRVSQGFITYMNVIRVIKERKLCVWKLATKSAEWQLVSEISTGRQIYTHWTHVPLGINPFDAKLVYFWSNGRQCLLSVNLHTGMFVHHSEMEHNKDNCYLRYFATLIARLEDRYSYFVLPQWPQRIPNTVTKV